MKFIMPNETQKVKLIRAALARIGELSRRRARFVDSITRRIDAERETIKKLETRTL